MHVLTRRGLAAATAVALVLPFSPTSTAVAAPPPSFTVDTLADTHDDDPGDDLCADAAGDCSLRAAVEEYGWANSDGAITFDAALDGGTIAIDAAMSEMVIRSSVAIQGPPSGITLDATNGLDGWSVVEFDLQKPDTAAISNVTILGDWGDGVRGIRAFLNVPEESPQSGPQGVDPAELPVANLVLDDVTVVGGSQETGGGIDVEGLNVRATDLTLLANDAFAGGGYHQNGGTVWIDGITANGNTAAFGAGVLIENAGVAIDNAVIDQNIAMVNGGGILLDSVWPIVEGGTVELFIDSVSGNEAGVPLLVADAPRAAGPAPEGILIGPDYGGDGGGIAVYNTYSIRIQPASGLAAGEPGIVDGNVAHGNGDFGAGTGYGGGVYIGDETYTVMDDVEVTGNTGHHGGGIYLKDYDELHGTNLLIADNTATEGGGLYNRAGSVILEDSDVLRNTANGDPVNPGELTYPGNGGGIWAQGYDADLAPPASPSPVEAEPEPVRPDFFGPGAIVMLGGSLSDNVADDANDDREANGGGIWAEDVSTVQLHDVTVTGNTAKDSGGGVWAERLLYDFYLNPPASGAPTTPEDVAYGYYYSGLVIGHTDISGNVALGQSEVEPQEGTGYGGGIFTLDAPTSIFQSSIVGNTAATEGGGIWTDTAYTGEYFNHVTSSTISQNTAVDGGGLWVSGVQAWQLDLVTVASNTATTAPAIYVGAIEENDEPYVFLRGTVVADHAAPACDVTNTGELGEYADGESANVFQDEGGGTSSCDGPGSAWINDGETYGPNQIVDDAGLRAELSTDGTVQFHLVEDGSPLIDAVELTEGSGDPSAPPRDPSAAPSMEGGDTCFGRYAKPGFDTDERLLPRGVDGDGDGDALCDAGAIEFRGLVNLTATTDGAEPDTDGSFTIARSGPTDLPVEVDLDVTGGTAISGADHAPIATTVTIPAGSTQVVVPVAVLDDAIVEPTETVEITITGADTVDLGTMLDGTVDIADDEDPDVPPDTKVIAGDDRIDTALEVAAEHFGPGSAPVVLLARSDEYADALATSSLAGALNAPILLTRPHDLPDNVATFIDELGSTRIIMMGGENAVGTEVAAELVAMGLSPERIGGEDRYETATRIFAEVVSILTAAGDMPAEGLDVFVTEGNDSDPLRGWPDAMSTASIAAAGPMPILLVTTDTLPAVTATVLESDEVDEIHLIGGQAAISTPVEAAIKTLSDQVHRLAGDDRYETAALVATTLAASVGLTTDTIWLATGLGFADGLVAGPAAARDGGLLMLVHGNDIEASATVHAFLDAANPTKVYFVGGENALSAAVRDAVIAAMS